MEMQERKRALLCGRLGGYQLSSVASTIRREGGAYREAGIGGGPYSTGSNDWE